MKTPPLHKSVCFLVLLLAVLNSCNGQSKKTDEIVSPAIAKGASKMKKTQGSNEYENVHCGLQDKKGNLWFGTTGEGVYSYDGKIFTQYTQKDVLSSNKVWSILEDRTGNIWFGKDAGVCRYDGKSLTKYSTKDGLTNNAVFLILEDKDGNIWVGTRNVGLYRFYGIGFISFSE